MGDEVAAPIRVLFVNPSPIRGGAEQMLESFLRGFDPARVTATVACLAPGPFAVELRDAKLDVRMIDAGRMRQVHRWAATVRALSRLAAGYDVVCSWQVKGHYYGTPAARLARRTAVWWDHGIRPVRGEPHAFAAGTIPRAIRSDLVLTSSRVAAARHRNGRAIHPGIDVAAFGGSWPDARSSLGIAGGGPVIGTVGRLQPWKGQHVFLRAAARIARDHAGATFVIAGDATGGFSTGYPAELRALAAELGIADRVVFAGERRDVARVLHAFDVFVHTSTEEPFGIVIVEAMAAGIPVIATRGGGVPEIVEDGVNGYLVRAGDDAAIAERAARLLRDPGGAQRVSAAALGTARARFGEQRMVDELTVALESLRPASRRAPAVAR